MEDKLKTSVLFLIDRMFLTLFYVEVSNIVRLSHKLKEHEAKIRHIIDKWAKRCD